MSYLRSKPAAVCLNVLMQSLRVPKHFFSLSSYFFFLLTFTQNMGINLTSVPFLAVVEQGEVSISALDAVTSSGPNKHL